MKFSNIVLIGFTGCGKSTFGRILAKKIDKYFLDTDSMIEAFLNKKIKNIFKEEGEKYFRKIEEKTSLWLKDNVKNTVIATGGGMAIYSKYINKIGCVIYLKKEFDNLIKDLKKEDLKKRPILNDINKAKIEFDKREAIYKEKANITINAPRTFKEANILINNLNF